MRKIVFWGTVLFSWQWSQGQGSDVTGFKVQIGSVSGSYSQTVDVPGGDKRSVSVPSIDTSKVNFARLIAYNSWGTESVPTAEIAFGGKPNAPVFLTATPAAP